MGQGSTKSRHHAPPAEVPTQRVVQKGRRLLGGRLVVGTAELSQASSSPQDAKSPEHKQKEETASIDAGASKAAAVGETHTEKVNSDPMLTGLPTALDTRQLLRPTGRGETRAETTKSDPPRPGPPAPSDARQPADPTGRGEDGSDRMVVQRGGFVGFQAKPFCLASDPVMTLEEWLGTLVREDPRGRFAQPQLDGLQRQMDERVLQHKVPDPKAILAQVKEKTPNLPPQLQDSILSLPYYAVEPTHRRTLLVYSAELYEEDGTTRCEYQIYREFNCVCRELAHAAQPSAALAQEWGLFRPYAALLNAAIEALPRVSAVLYRGASMRIDSAAYPIGARGSWGGAVSATSDRSQAVSFVGKMGLKASKGCYFVLLCDEARPVFHLSLFPEEMEHLHPLEQEFEVCGVLPASILQMLALNVNIVTLKGAGRSLPLELHFAALEGMGFIYDEFLRSYIPPFVKDHPSATVAHPIEGKIEQFVAQRDQRLLLIAAPSGMGKTSCALWLARATHRLGRTWLFVSLPVVENLFGPEGLVRHLQTSFGFSAEEMGRLRQHPLVLILDSLDEVKPPAPPPAQSWWQLNGFEAWDLKLVVTCRVEHTKDYGLCLGTPSAVYIDTFGEEQIEAYISKRLVLHDATTAAAAPGAEAPAPGGGPQADCSAGAAPRDSRAAQSSAATDAAADARKGSRATEWAASAAPQRAEARPPPRDPMPRTPPATSPADEAPPAADPHAAQVKDLMRRIRESPIRRVYGAPFQLSMGMDLLLQDVEAFGFPRLADLYAAWLERFLLQKGEEDVPHAVRQLEGLALDLHRQGRAHARVGELGTQAWFHHAPLRVNNYAPESQFSYKHKSIQEYLVATRLFRALRESGAQDLLSSIHVTSDLPVLRFFSDLCAGEACRDPGAHVVPQMFQRLWGNVLASRGSAERGVCAANSISLLNAAGYLLSGKDLSDVHIPKANLQCARMSHSSLRGANLRGADLKGAELDFVDLRGADLMDAVAGELVKTLRGHTSDVTSVAFSPDGATLVSASRDHSLRVWGAGTGELVRTLQGHTEPVTAVAFSPDGATIASGSEDKSLRLWSAGTGEPAATLLGHGHHVTSVAFSPDGATIASASGDATVRVWRAGTGAHAHTLQGHAQYVTAVAFSPDGATIASGSWDATVQVWRAATGDLVRTLKGHTNWVTAVAFSPDGATVASAARDDTVRLWSAATGEHVKSLLGHARYVTAVAFSPDGTTVASASWDQSVRTWSAGTGELVKTVQGHTNWVTAVAFSPDGATIASASKDETVRLWAAGTADLLKPLQGHSHYVTSVAFSADGATVASASEDKTLRVWRADTGELVRLLGGRAYDVTSVAFAPDGAAVAAGARDKRLRLWSAGTGELLRTLEGHLWPVTCVAFSPDGATLASASQDATVRLWATATGEPVRTLKGHTKWVTSVAFSPDGATVASASRDASVRLWSAGTGDHVRSLQGHTHAVTAMALAPDGGAIVSASQDKKLRLCSAATGELVRTMEGHTEAVTSVAFAPDGTAVASASQDGTVWLWSVGTGAHMKSLRGHTNWVTAVAFSPDGATLASASRDATVRLWSAGAEEQRGPSEGETDPANAMAAVGSSSGDADARLWGAGTGLRCKALREVSHQTCCILAFGAQFAESTRLPTGVRDLLCQAGATDAEAKADAVPS